MRAELSLRLLLDGYRAVEELRRANGGAGWFPARMLGRRALVVRGPDGVRTFYDAGLVTRRGAIPAPIRLLLFGPGAVHGLNGEAHRRRKSMYLKIVDREAVEQLSLQVAERLDTAVRSWPERGSVRLFDELVAVYGAAVLSWGGTESSEQEARAVSPTSPP